MTTCEWSEIGSLANTDQGENKEEGERERRMKEASIALKMSWGETGKKQTDIIREKLDETVRLEEEGDKMEVERILKEKEAKRAELVKKAWEVIRRSKAEGEHIALDKAVMLNRVAEENERSLTVRKKREELEVKRVKEVEERCRREWERYDAELRGREEERLETERKMAMFQRYQLKEKFAERRRDVEDSRERRKLVEERGEKVMSEQKVREMERRWRLRVELTEERKELDEERKKRKEEIEKVEEAEREEDARRRGEEEKRRREEMGEMLKRRVALVRRQDFARQWLRENVWPVEAAKVVKAEKNIATARLFEAEREKQRLDKVKQMKDKSNSDVIKFIEYHNSVRATERENAKSAKALEAKEDHKKIKEHLDRVEIEGKEKEAVRGRLLSFWEGQKGELREGKMSEKRREIENQQLKRKEECEALEGVIVRGRKLIESNGEEKGMLTKKVEDIMGGLSGEAEVVATDASGIRIRRRERVKADPRSDRERMSLNWGEGVA